jgi:hypothetical protein
MEPSSITIATVMIVLIAAALARAITTNVTVPIVGH